MRCWGIGDWGLGVGWGKGYGKRWMEEWEIKECWGEPTILLCRGQRDRGVLALGLPFWRVVCQVREVIGGGYCKTTPRFDSNCGLRYTV